MMKTRVQLVTLAAVLALVAAACGGGGSNASKTTTTVALTTQQLADRAQPATVELHGKVGNDDVGGSGVIIDSARALVLTNAHVVSGVAALKARINEQVESPAQVVASDPCNDVAIVRLTQPPPGIRSLPLGDSGTLKRLDNVVALGYPASFNDPTKERVVVTTGAVQTQGDIAAEPDPSLPKYPALIQHSATINPGNSGGPLVNARAELVGINTLTNPGTKSQPVQGQYYAISINYIKRLLPDLQAGKSQDNIGWNVVPFREVPLADVYEATGYGTRSDGDAADRYLAQNRVDGMFVLGIDPSTPAADANLGVTELVTKLANTDVATMGQVCDVLQSASPGQTLAVEGIYLLPGQDHAQFASWTDKLTVKS
jgi:S1-C subfamily serine protease